MIIIRTFGGGPHGYGHVYRCLSLAQALRTKRVFPDIVFVINESISEEIEKAGFSRIISDDIEKDYCIIDALRPELVIIDGYDITDEYLLSLKDIVRIAFIDDNNDVCSDQVPDLILNGNLYASDLDYQMDNGRFLLGADYLLMKEEYWNNEGTNYPQKEGIFISTGGSDSFDLTPKIMKALADCPLKKRIIIGPGFSEQTIATIRELTDNSTEIIWHPKSIKQYILESKVAVIAAGSTVYEVISQQTLPIVFGLAKNQRNIYNFLKARKVQTIGFYPNIQYKDIGKIIKKELREKKTLDLSIDGKGALRAADALITYFDLKRY